MKKNNSERNTVMFVDDEQINLLLFKKRFESDFNVITADSGQQALEKLDENHDKLKVVISDMGMPHMTGLQLITAAKKRYPEAIKYFILTGYNYSPELEAALEEHLIDKLLNKPYDYEVIKEAVGI